MNWLQGVIDPTREECAVFISKPHALKIVEAHGFDVVTPKGTMVCGIPSDRDVETPCGLAFWKECWLKHATSNGSIQAGRVIDWLRNSLNSDWRVAYNDSQVWEASDEY